MEWRKSFGVGGDVCWGDLYQVASFRVVSQHHWDPAVANPSAPIPSPPVPPTPLLCSFPLPSFPFPSPPLLPSQSRLEPSALRLLARTKVTAVFFFSLFLDV